MGPRSAAAGVLVPALLPVLFGLVSPPGAAAQPGDTFEDPLFVPALPFLTTGNTCGFVDNYDVMCPFGGMGPDIVYAYDSPTQQVVNVSLCESYYDTKLMVYEDDNHYSHLIGCNDDACSGPNYSEPYVSYLSELLLQEGHTYYFIVDGYGNGCGDYILRIVPSVSCELACPQGADEEGEPKCENGYVDETNGGCGATPPVFQDIELAADPVVICAFSGTFLPFPYRDYDWYEINPTDTVDLTIHCTADFPAFYSLFDGNAGCEDRVPLEQTTTEPCEATSWTLALDAGTYWFVVRPLFASGTPCSSRYVVSFEGSPGPPVSVIRIESSETRFGIFGVRPNPVVTSGTIEYGLLRTAPVSLGIFDVSGRLIRVLVDEPGTAGRHAAKWDGRDKAGVAVGPGVYFARLESAGTVGTWKIVRAAE